MVEAFLSSTAITVYVKLGGMMKLQEYPTDLERASIDAARVQREAAELRERFASIEAILTLEITNAKTPEGKPLYTNEATRAATLTLRLQESSEATEIKQMLARADERRNEHVARIERLRGEFKIALLERQAEITAHSTPLVI